MIKTRIVDPEAEAQLKDVRPAIIKWRGVDIIRNHSLRATVKEIIATLQVLDVVKVGVIGEPSTGKSSLEDTLAHLIHKMSPIPFATRSLGEEEFMNLEAYLASLPPANYILKFRDLSFLKGKYGAKKIEELKQANTKIRHLPGGKDVKIVLIYDYHYTMGLDKYLRQANFRYFTSVGSSEKDNVLEIVGQANDKIVDNFARVYVEMTTKEKHLATYMIGKKPFHYKYKDPFVPCLFWNNANLRTVVFPLRTWIDPICSICATGDSPLLQSEIDVNEYKEQTDAKFPPGVFKSAVKLKLFLNGRLTYSPKVVQALRYLDRSLETKIINLEELAVAYGLELTKTALRQKQPQVITN